MLRLNDIKVTFNPSTANEKHALNGIDLGLPKGDFVTIIGSNGAGKSTLFSVIAGNLQVDQGEIVLDNKNITYMPEYKRSKEIGRLFQDPLKGTAPNMTIEENMSLAYLRAGKAGGLFTRVKKTERDFFRARLESLGLGLENRMKSPVGLLSGGQRQALTLLMSTLVTPKLLLLDEHTAALDPATGEKVLALTKEIISKDDITCLMITHNISNALELGNRTIMMDSGKIVFDVSGEERKTMTVDTILEAFRKNAKKALDNDRILLNI